MLKFIDYLRELFMSNYAGADDDSPEAFDTWMENLTQDDLIDFCDKYADIIKLSEPH